MKLGKKGLITFITLKLRLYFYITNSYLGRYNYFDQKSEILQIYKTHKYKILLHLKSY